MTPHQQVKEFMLAFGQECPNTPGFPSDDICKLRPDLVTEESSEHREAFENLDYVKVCDAICDLLYVVYGSAIAIGLNEDTLNKMFAEVHRSNMSKMWTWEEAASQPEYWLGEIKLSLAENAPAPKRWIVRNLDGKVLKSPSYTPPDLEQFLPCSLTSSTTGTNSPQSPSGK